MTSTRRRIDAVDGLRGLAAASVLVFHVYNTAAPGWEHLDGVPHSIRETLHQLGPYAVELFFVLSGFLVGLPFVRAVLTGERVDLGRYARTRLGRILPLWWLVAGLTLLAFFPAVLGQPAHVALLATLQQSYDPDLIRRYVPHGWSLVIEVSFYAVLPLVAIASTHLARRLPRRRRPVAVVAPCLAAVAASWAFKHATLWTQPVPHPDLRWESWSLPAFADAFALGGLVALLHLTLDGRARAALGAACLGLSAPVWWIGLGDPQRVTNMEWMAVAFALLAAGVVLWESGPLARALTLQPLRALGRWTYGLYLWHLPLLYGLLRLGVVARDDPAQAPRAIALVLALSAAAAALSWRYVEQPCLRRAREARLPARLRGRLAPGLGD